MKFSVSFKRSEQIQSGFKGCCLHPERVNVHMCTAVATVRHEKLAVSSFKHVSLMSVDFLRFSFLSFSEGLSCILCPLGHGQCVYLCLHVWTREHACVQVVLLRFQETLMVLTRKICSSFMLAIVSVIHLCYLQEVCVQLQTAYICLDLLRHSFPWLAQSVSLFLYKVFIFSQREWYTYCIWEGGKTEVPMCPVG